MEKPLHAIQGLEEAARRLDWERRTILGDSMCSICWPCYHLMAFGCRGRRGRCYCLELLFGTLQRSYCLSGLSEIAFLIMSVNLGFDVVRNLYVDKFVLGLKFYLKRFFQEGSLQLGLAYIVAVVSLFDEYVNDLLALREGSCLPRYILLQLTFFS